MQHGALISRRILTSRTLDTRPGSELPQVVVSWTWLQADADVPWKRDKLGTSRLESERGEHFLYNVQ